MKQSATARAERFGLAFDESSFSIRELERRLLEQRSCPCCLRDFDYSYTGTGEAKPGSPSLDRLRPSLGYVPGNVAIICFRCNRLKNDATPEELQRIADWLRAELRADS